MYTDLNALLDPEVSCHGLPVLRARDVEETIEEPLLDAAVEDLHELLPHVRLTAAQTRQEGRLQLRRQLTAAQRLVPTSASNMWLRHFYVKVT